MQGVQNEDRENKGDTTENSVLTGKPVRDTASSVEEQPTFEIDLRVEEVSQDAILKDEEQMKKINDTLEKLNSGSCTKSVRMIWKFQVI